MPGAGGDAAAADNLLPAAPSPAAPTTSAGAGAACDATTCPAAVAPGQRLPLAADGAAYFTSPCGAEANRAGVLPRCQAFEASGVAAGSTCPDQDGGLCFLEDRTPEGATYWVAEHQCGAPAEAALLGEPGAAACAA